MEFYKLLISSVSPQWIDFLGVLLISSTGTCKFVSVIVVFPHVHIKNKNFIIKGFKIFVAVEDSFRSEQ